MAPFAGAAIGVQQDVGEGSDEAGVGVPEEREVFAGTVEELDAAGCVDGFALWTLGLFPPGDFSRVVLTKAGYDAGMPVGPCCWIREIGAFTEEGPVYVECIAGVGLQDHEAVVRRMCLGLWAWS